MCASRLPEEKKLVFVIVSRPLVNLVPVCCLSYVSGDINSIPCRLNS